MKGINSLFTSLSPKLWVSTLSLTWNWIPLLVNPRSIVRVSSNWVVTRSNDVVVVVTFLPILSSTEPLTVSVLVPNSLVSTFIDDQASSHPPHWIGANPVFGSTSSCCKACVNPASISTTLESNLLSFNHTSLLGFNSTPPTHVIAANGFTFSVLVANDWLIYDISVKSKVTTSPVLFKSFDCKSETWVKSAAGSAVVPIPITCSDPRSKSNPWV